MNAIRTFDEDIAIAQSILKRDGKVTREYLYRKCYPMFKSIYNNYFTDSSDVYEFINEIYILILTPSKDTGRCQLDNFRGKSALSTWLKSFFSTAKEDDVVVFFFSGHGGKGGLCAYDTSSEKTMVTYAEVQQAIRSCKANSKQMFIDACYSGGLRANIMSASQTNAKQSPISDTEGVMLFLSSRTGETSQENPWSDNGFFT